MGNDRTVPEQANSTTNPISRVESRVVPQSRVKASTIEPRMTQAHRTLAALAVASNDPPLNLRAEFKLNGIGMLRTTTLGNFLLIDQNSADGPGFVLSFEYRGREGLKYVAESVKVYDVLREMLVDRGLAFKGATSATACRLTVEPMVPASITITAERSRERVTMTLRNVAVFGSSTYVVPLERFDHKLVDALVELISNQDRAFYDLLVGAR